MKRNITLTLITALVVASLSGCGKKNVSDVVESVGTVVENVQETTKELTEKVDEAETIKDLIVPDNTEETKEEEKQKFEELELPDEIVYEIPEGQENVANITYTNADEQYEGMWNFFDNDERFTSTGKQCYTFVNPETGEKTEVEGTKNCIAALGRIDEYKRYTLEQFFGKGIEGKILGLSRADCTLEDFSKANELRNKDWDATMAIKEDLSIEEYDAWTTFANAKNFGGIEWEYGNPPESVEYVDSWDGQTYKVARPINYVDVGSFDDYLKLLGY